MVIHIYFLLVVRILILVVKHHLKLIYVKRKIIQLSSIATGKLSKTKGRPRCKIVNILFADTNDCFDEIREAIINRLPIIVVRGSLLCN